MARGNRTPGPPDSHPIQKSHRSVDDYCSPAEGEPRSRISTVLTHPDRTSWESADVPLNGFRNPIGAAAVSSRLLALAHVAVRLNELAIQRCAAANPSSDVSPLPVLGSGPPSSTQAPRQAGGDRPQRLLLVASGRAVVPTGSPNCGDPYVGEALVSRACSCGRKHRCREIRVLVSRGCATPAVWPPASKDKQCIRPEGIAPYRSADGARRGDGRRQRC